MKKALILFSFLFTSIGISTSYAGYMDLTNVEGAPSGKIHVNNLVSFPSACGHRTNCFDADSEASASSITLTAPKNEPLTTKTYYNAGEAFFDDSAPGLDVGFNGVACTDSKGQFTIYSITRNKSGAIEHLNASFLYKCGNMPTIHGMLVY